MKNIYKLLFVNIKINSIIFNNNILDKLKILKTNIQLNENKLESFNNIFNILTHFSNKVKNKKIINTYSKKKISLLEKIIKDYEKFIIIFKEYNSDNIKNKNNFLLQLNEKLLEKYKLFYSLNRNLGPIYLNKKINTLYNIQNTQKYISELKRNLS